MRCICIRRRQGLWQFADGTIPNGEAQKLGRLVARCHSPSFSCECENGCGLSKAQMHTHYEPGHGCETCACVWVMVAACLCAKWYSVDFEYKCARKKRSHRIQDDYGFWIWLIRSFCSSHFFLKKCQEKNRRPHNEKWLFENYENFAATETLCKWWEMNLGLRHPMKRNLKNKTNTTPI